MRKNSLYLLILFLLSFTSCLDNDKSPKVDFKFDPTALEKSDEVKNAIKQALNGIVDEAVNISSDREYELLIDSLLHQYAKDNGMKLVDSVYQNRKLVAKKLEKLLEQYSSRNSQTGAETIALAKTMNEVALITRSRFEWEREVLERYSRYDLADVTKKRRMDKLFLMVNSIVEAYEQQRVVSQRGNSRSILVPLNMNGDTNDGSSFWSNHSECLMSYASGAVYQILFMEIGLTEDEQMMLIAHTILMSKAGIVVCD